jgi:hypothetical protein
MSRFIAALSVLVVVVFTFGFWVGWITFHKSPETATIEIKTKEIEHAGEKAVESGRRLVEDAAESVKKAVHEDQGDTAKDKSETDTATTPSKTTVPR